MLKVWESEEGQKQWKLLVELLKLSKDRAEFQNKFLEFAGNPPFKDMNWDMLLMRLIREARSKKSEMGKLWKNLPRGAKGGNVSKENPNLELTPEQVAEREK